LRTYERNRRWILVGNEMDGSEGKENGKVKNSGRENIASCDRFLSFRC
jgi:hypothetical protein